MLTVHLFVSYAHVNLCHFFLFFLVSEVGCGFCLWLFLDCSTYLFVLKVQSSSWGKMVAFLIGKKMVALFIFLISVSQCYGQAVVYNRKLL